MNLIAIPVIGITLFLSIYFYKVTKNIGCPVVIFNIMWLFAAVLQQININDYYRISEYTYAIILLGIISFNIPFIIMGKKFYKKTNSIEKLEILSYENVRRVILLQSIILLFLIPLFFRALEFQKIYGFEAMRTVYAKSVEYGYMTAKERMFYIHYIVFPLSMILNCIQIILWCRGIAKTKHLILCFLNEAMIATIASSRGNVLVVMLFFIFTFLLSSIKKEYAKKIYLKRKREIKYLIMIGVSVLLIITILRKNLGEGNFIIGILKTLSTVFAGGFNLLDLSINNPQSWGLDFKLYGLATFYGFFQIIQTMVVMLSRGKISLSFISNSNVTTYAESFYNVSSTAKMNAYTTILYTFMRDFGIFGVAFIMLVFGWICGYVYYQFIKTNSIKSEIYLILLLIFICYSTIRWRLITSDWASMVVHIIWLVPFIKGKFRIKIK